MVLVVVLVLVVLFARADYRLLMYRCVIVL